MGWGTCGGPEGALDPKTVHGREALGTLGFFEEEYNYRCFNCFITIQKFGRGVPVAPHIIQEERVGSQRSKVQEGQPLPGMLM